jgi:hypothetical protein
MNPACGPAGDVHPPGASLVDVKGSHASTIPGLALAVVPAASAPLGSY